MLDQPVFEMPARTGDEREDLLGFLDFKRAAVLRTARDLTDAQARWTPDGGLLPVAGVLEHLTHVEQRWIDGRYLQLDTPAADPALEFASTRPLAELVDAYCERRLRTNEIVRSAPDLSAPCRGGHTTIGGLDLRWVLLHLLEETSHHAGHADATRELLDGARSTD